MQRLGSLPAYAASALLVVSALSLAPGIADPVGVRGESSHEAPLDSSVRQTLESWDFTGLNGSLSFTSNETTFVDFAFPITEDTDAESINISVSFTWRGPRPDDQQQPWACAYWGLRTDDDTVFDPLSTAGCGYYMKDGTLEISAGVLGNDVGHSQPHPLCSVAHCFDDERSLSSSSAQAFAVKSPEHLLREYERPVGHLMYRAGGMYPVEVDVEARWTDSVVAVSTLDRAGDFDYFAEEFDTVAHARADSVVTFSPAYQLGAVLQAELGDGRRTFFVNYDLTMGDFLGFPCCTDWEAGYMRPDGTTRRGEQLEISSQHGEWTFWDNESLSEEADRLTVMGGPIEWALLPWETQESN